MGKYTILENPLIDDEIDKILNSLANQIVGVFHPESIILSGSFGRGEGSVLYQNDNAKIISDFEIGVISKKYYKRLLCREVSQRISRKLNIDLTLNFYLPSRFTKNKATNFSGRNRHLTIDQYELRYGSKLLYGKDYISEMKDYSAKDIPIWEGLRLTFNRIAESLEYFPPNGDKSKTYMLKKWIYKTILACSDVLLISLGRYHFLCRVRLGNLISAYKNHLQDLFSDSVPEFPDLVRRATLFKLKPNVSHNENLERLWFQTTTICDIVLRYAVKKDMEFEYLDYIDFQEKYLRHPNLRKKYFREFTGFPWYQNVVHLGRMGQQLKVNKVKKSSCLFLGVSLVHLLYATIALLYFGLESMHEFDKEYLRKAENNLRLITSFQSSGRHQTEWLEAKYLAVALWSAVCN